MTWPTDRFTLPADRIHLWFCKEQTVKESKTLALYQALLAPDEIEQLARFHFERDRYRYLLARCLVRSVLTLYHPVIRPENWQFKKNPYGRPEIANPVSLPLYFNLSHSDKMVVMAVAAEQSIGVDVETIQRRNTGNELKLADRFFSPEEARQLSALPKSGQKNRFFQLWTLKEAYIKACGKGLSIPLDHFSFSFPDQSAIELRFASDNGDSPQNWLFWQFSVEDGFYVSVAYRPAKKNTDIGLTMFNVSPLHWIEPIFLPIFRQKSRQ
ncbi:MAG: 4-phosphopantetheinyl transferase [Gammaproteobacteria bacterium]|nr:MAG: 4-phosphopantetheinyl transferase [Gammaproteobacteria bacterium]